MPLEVNEARQFTRRGRSIVVTLVGMRECGKTSLLARLHQLFQSGPIEEFVFAGSRSLPYLEELNWLATVESGANKVTMTRSSTQFDNCFIHLAVRSDKTTELTDLLINDVTGETFEAAIADQGTCEKLIALARADHLVVLLDGSSLANRGTRHHHFGQVRDFVQRVIQSGQCGKKTSLHFVISKMDELKSQEAIADKIEADLTTNFKSSMAELRHWRIAARPMDGSTPTVKLLNELFASWLRVTHRYDLVEPGPLSTGLFTRDFCKLSI
ncbi:TRAFAC clade GTPase domain-containing protein [Prosthecobacter sp.]|uniref:TRAFAC clade GTPase domain-containing protein n=1 Tax=Prosthecobacter sp. TaxID=1965333 RepID=UPI00378470CB